MPADVTLTIAVASKGVQAAIDGLKKVEQEGITTAKSFQQLTTASAELEKSLAKAFANPASGATRAKAQYNQATTAITRMNEALREQVKLYTEAAQKNTGGDARSRITTLGSGNYEEGLAKALQLVAQEAREAATFSSDLNIIFGEEAQKAREAAGAQAALAAQLRQMAEAQRLVVQGTQQRAEANQNLSRAKEDLAGQVAGLSAVERAEVLLARATQDLAAAQEKTKSTAAGAFNSERTSAINAEAGAIQGLIRAETQLADATNAAKVEAQVRAEQELAAATRAAAIQEQARTDQLRQFAAAQRLVVQGTQQRAEANQNLSRAKEDLAGQAAGMNSLQRAEVTLVRTTEDLAVARAATKAAGAGAFNAERTAAMNNEARAIENVIRAEQQLAAETKNASAAGRGMGDAFQSSFAYFALGNILHQVSQGIKDVGEFSITASAQIQRSFADVNRTFDGTATQLASLKATLFALSTTIPVSFVDLSQIAALGNQLGIAAADIQDFTKVIAEYSTISGETADASATSFGKIAALTGLSASQFSNLGSSIEYVARKTVATEATISSTSKEIAALASGAGFSAQGVVGLAGALSSLSIPPERARGSLSLYFGALNKAIAEGGPKLAAFGVITGKTKDELNNLVRSGQGQEVFTSFVAGLSKLDSVAKTSALKELGLSGIRVDQTFRALSQNVPLLTSSLAGANNAFQQNVELGNQYGKIQQTLASVFTEFQNSVQNAAAAAGDAAKVIAPLLLGLTHFLVGFAEFAHTPVGSVLTGIAISIGIVAFALSAVVGAAALGRASLAVTTFAFKGMGDAVTSTSPAILRYVAGLLGINVANNTLSASQARIIEGQLAVSVALGQGTISAAEAVAANRELAASELTVAGAAEAAGVGLGVVRAAFISTGVGILLVGLGLVAGALLQTKDASKLTADSVTGLSDAIKADTETYAKTGRAIASYSAHLPGMTSDQKAASRSAKNLANVLGVDIPAGATAAGDAIKKIAIGDKVTEVFRSALSKNDVVKGLATDSQFVKQFQGIGLTMTDLIAAGVKSKGSDQKLRQYLLEKLGPVTERVVAGGKGGSAVARYLDKSGNDVTKFRDQLLSLGPVAASIGTTIKDTATSTSFFADKTNAAGDAVTALNDGFLGGVSGLADYQSALQAGVSSFVDVSTILSSLQSKADAAAGTKKNKNPGVVNANEFDASLVSASNSAVSFYNNINKLADGGNTQFATELAKLGPAAQGVLSSALSLSPSAQHKIEADARFAAFLGSDAFKTAYNKEMSVDNEAYARIFKTTGNLSDVKAYITAQANGTAKAYEQAWDAAHPTFPLKAVLKDLTPADIQVFQAQADGKLTITAGVILKPGGLGGNGKEIAGNTITDTVSGNSIVLPATLDRKALSASAQFWLANENATPAQIAAALATQGFPAEVTDAIRSLGTVGVPIVPTIANGALTGIAAKLRNLGKVSIVGNATGGLIDQYGKGQMPSFATGGSWGQYQGGGTGTSDSLLARVSRGEFISTADATNYWGADFFASLNRKMLPASVVSMLSAAAGGGNSGPSHVAYVNVAQHNPVTRDPLAQLRESSEMVAAGIWSGS